MTDTSAKSGILKPSQVNHTVFILLVSLFFCFESVQAVKYLSIGKDGSRFYKCDSSCGKVRVKKSGKNRYRVYSIPFSGELDAGSEEEAATAACKESQKPLKRLINPIPSRDIPNC
jgi:hypothetical protein